MAWNDNRRKPWWPWTPERVETLSQLIGLGLPYSEIAKRMSETADAVRGAAQRHGLMRPERLSRGQPWAREDFDTLEALLSQGLAFAEIAERMGRTYNGVRGAVCRLGLTDKQRQRHRLRRDWPEIDPIIRDCIEVEQMCVPQIVERLTALGYTITRQAIHGRLGKIDRSLRNQVRQNAERRRALWRSIHAKRRAIRARQQKEKAA